MARILHHLVLFENGVSLPQSSETLFVLWHFSCQFLNRISEVTWNRTEGTEL